MTDPAHDLADKTIEDLAIRIDMLYKDAANGMTKALKKYMATYKKTLDIQKKRLDEGDISKGDFDKWCAEQAASIHKYVDMVEDATKRIVAADKASADAINTETPYVFSENNAYGSYEVENGYHINTGYELPGLDSVNALLSLDPTLVPLVDIDTAKATEWYQRKVQSAMIQGMSRGESIPKIAKRLQSVCGMGKSASIRTARTEVTCAENAGKQTAYKRAQSMGINVQKKWVATLDSRTRASHRMVDGEIRELDERFSNGCLHPGDKTAPGYEVYNCRCSERAWLPGISQTVADRFSRLGEVTYDEWKSGKNTPEWEAMQAKKREREKELRKKAREKAKNGQ